MKSPSVDVLVGSFTDDRGSGEGLVLVTFEGSTLRRNTVVRPPMLLRSPSFLTAVPHPDGAAVYAVEAGADHVVGLRWRRDRPSDVELLGRVGVGAGPCHVTIDAERGVGVVCAYGDGSVTSFRVAESGALARPRVHRPPGGRTDTAVSRAHCALLLDDRVLTTDTGRDRINVWRWDAGHGLVWESEVRLPPGSGPRHLRRHDTGAVYVSCEYTGALGRLRIGDGGVFSLELCVPPDARAGESFGAAEVALARNGRSAYVGGRRDAVMVEYALDEAGISWRGFHPSGGGSPRHHVIVGDSMLVGNERSHEVVAFRIGGPGRPPERLGSIGVRSPTCLLVI